MSPYYTGDPALMTALLLSTVAVGMARDTRLESGLAYIEFSKKMGGFAKTFVLGLGGIVAAVFGSAIAIGEAAVNVVVSIFDAFGVGLPAWVLAFTLHPAQFISQSFDTAARSIRFGPFAELGPFVPWIAALSAIGVVAMVVWYLDKTDSDVPGAGIDLPFIGETREEDGDDDLV